MWEIVQTGQVKTVCLRQPGAEKGVRLVHLRSLIDYLLRFAEGGTEANPKHDQRAA